MSYRLYHTEGFILDSREAGEANRTYYLLTPDLGLVAAHAQGVRQLKSKLRGQLRELSHVSVGLIRGREVWRLVHAEAGMLEENLAAPDRRAEIARLFALLRRLIHGEERHPELFYDLKNWLAEAATSSSELRSEESAMALRLLCHLGYADRAWLATPPPPPVERRQLIEQALSASQL